MTNTPSLAIVVVNFGSHELLRRNLVPLSISAPDVTVVVVDNFSSDDERRIIIELCDTHGWRAVYGPNRGFGAGMNRGVADALASGASELLLLNPDAVLHSADLRALMACLNERPRALVCPTIRRPDRSVWFDGATLDLRRGRTISRMPRPGDPTELGWSSAACILLTADTWAELGGFDEDYFLYWEDVDLSVRAHLLGLELVVLPDVTAVHDEGGTHGSSDSDRLSWIYYRFNVRNRLVFAAKFLSTRDLVRWYAHTPTESYRVMLRGDGRRVFLTPVESLRALLGGVLDGLMTGWRLRRRQDAGGTRLAPLGRPTADRELSAGRPERPGH